MSKIEPRREERRYKDIYQNESAEDKVCEFLESAINDKKFVGQHNFKIQTRECDIAMVIPNRGILIIEVKGYPAKIIESMSSSFIISIKKKYESERFKNGERHPAEQANDYVFTMIKDFAGYLKRNNLNLPVCKIGRMVAMPNITDNEYEKLCLDYCYSTKLVITKDWFENKDIFYSRFMNALNTIFNSIKCEVDFDENYYNIAKRYIVLSERQKQVSIENEQLNQKINICYKKLNEIENNEIKSFSNIIQKESIKWIDNTKMVPYSKLRIVKSGCKIQLIMETCYKERKEGIKQFLICINFTHEEKEDIKLEYKNKYSRNYKEDELLFLFNMYFIDLKEGDSSLDILYKETKDIEITNGNRIQEILSLNNDNIIAQKFLPTDILDKALWNVLCIVDNNTKFNFDQYIVEHSPLRKNIVVTASAGTGKTYTMVDRVSFVTHMEIICGNQRLAINDLISMMTFTNNSTDEMKDRLMKHFKMYFELTNNKIYMDIIEQLGKMKIKTIDSFTKYILSKFSHLIGLSNKFSLKSGKYEVENILRKHINKEINKDIIDDFYNINVYEIANYILSLRSYLINHKIQFDKEKYANIVEPDVGKGTLRIKKFIESVLTATNSEYNEFNRSQNFVAMNELAIQLEQIEEILKNEDNSTYTEEEYKKYLFIDEFQDTDSKQIQLIRFFSDYFKTALFVVGDEKQCIYGFRGAEKTSFSELICEDYKFKRRKWIKCSLRKNYRTDKPLIECMDNIFSKMPKDLFNYEEKDKLVAQRGIKRIDKECYKEFEYSEAYLIKLVDTCIEKMKTNQENGIIAILTRCNYEVNQIRTLFEGKKEYEVEFDNGGLFYSTDAVIDFYKLVDFLINPEDGGRRYSFLKTPYSDFKVKESRFKLYENANIMDIETFEKIRSGNEHPSLQKYYDILHNDNNEYHNLKNSPTLKILRMIVNEVKPWEHYIPEEYKCFKFDNLENKLKLEEAREEYRKNLFQLFQKLIEDNRTDYLTLNKIHQFLSIGIFTRQECDIESSEEFSEKNIIRVLCTTVHKSKGLQYHTVIMPFTTNDITESRGSTQFIYKEEKNQIYMKIKENNGKRQVIYESRGFEAENEQKNKMGESEELRILYVALTRAKKNFYYMVDKDKIAKNRNTKKYWSEYLAQKGDN